MQQAIHHLTAKLGPCLADFLREEQKRWIDIPAKLPQLLQAIGLTGKVMHQALYNSSLTASISATGSYNASGDAQQPLDLKAHRYFSHALAATGEVGAMLSEEADNIIELPSCGSYIVAFDPLDGSANIEVNAPIGTIFSVYQRLSSPKAPIQPEDVLQKGHKQVAAGYLLYSTSTLLVYTAGHGVHVFTYAPAIGTFFLTQQAIKMPAKGKMYALNDGYFDVFPSHVQRYIKYGRQHNFSARYIGTLVADFHRNLIKGGIYMYPPTQKHPSGKLRLVLECNALAFIAQQAGGSASDGTQDILAIKPEAIHQRVPLYIGSTYMVQQLLSLND